MREQFIGNAIRFMNGSVLDSKLISKICNKVLLAIKDELPEEARTYEVYKYFLDESKELLENKTIIL